MLNTIAFILQHPLVVFAFLYWSLTSPFTHEDWQRSAARVFAKMGFGRVGLEKGTTSPLRADVPLTTTMSPEFGEEFTTTEPPVVALLRERLRAARLRERTQEFPTTEPREKFDEFKEFTIEPPVEAVHLYKHLGHRHRHGHEGHCPDAAAHLGKWSRGCPHQMLHYVCKSNRPEWCETYGWKRFGNSCYHAELEDLRTYKDAMLACQSNRYETQLIDADLVTIKSEAENKFVQRLVSAQTVWIGLSKTNGTWSWTDRSALKSDSYVNWDNQSISHAGAHVQAAFMNDWKVLCMPPPWLDWLCPKMFIVAVVATMVCSCLSSLLVKLTYCCAYKSIVTDKRQPFAAQAQQAPDFHHGPFGCFEDMDVCLHACCCTSIRAADTHKAAGSSEFWVVIGWWIFAAIIGPIIGCITGVGGLASGLILSGIMTHKRQMLKARLGIAPGSFCVDFLLWWCCSPCAVAQEARHVDEVNGVKVRCCCSMRQRRSPVVHPLVGSGISLQTAPDIPPQAPPAYSQQPAAPNNMVMPSQYPVHVVTAQVVHIQPPSANPPPVGPPFQMGPVV